MNGARLWPLLIELEYEGADTLILTVLNGPFNKTTLALFSTIFAI